MVSKEPNLTGYAILLTNEPRYWETPAKPPKTKDREFRIHKGRKLSRRMDWQPDTAKSTKKGREKPIRLKKDYPIVWRRYQTIRGSKNNELWYLMMKVS